jgi:hypothetical protein
MARQTVAPDLSDQEVARRLQAAQADEQEGRIVHCENEAELREFFRTLPDQA